MLMFSWKNNVYYVQWSVSMLKFANKHETLSIAEAYVNVTSLKKVL